MFVGVCQQTLRKKERILCKFSCWCAFNAWVSVFSSTAWIDVFGRRYVDELRSLEKDLLTVFDYTHQHKQDLDIDVLQRMTFEYKIEDDLYYVAVESARSAIGAVLALELKEDEDVLEEFLAYSLLCSRVVHALRNDRGNITRQELQGIYENDAVKLKELLKEV